jgi:hypothetical protein
MIKYPPEIANDLGRLANDLPEMVRDLPFFDKKRVFPQNQVFRQRATLRARRR